MVSHSSLPGGLTKIRPAAIASQIGADAVELPIPVANPPTEMLVKISLTSRSGEMRCICMRLPLECEISIAFVTVLAQISGSEICKIDSGGGGDPIVTESG